MLSAPALAVRVEVRTPAAGRPKKVGEIHMVAGGVSEVISGELRGDDAMDHLRGVSPLSFRLQPHERREFRHIFRNDARSGRLTTELVFQ